MDGSEITITLENWGKRHDIDADSSPVPFTHNSFPSSILQQTPITNTHSFTTHIASNRCFIFSLRFLHTSRVQS